MALNYTPKPKSNPTAPQQQTVTPQRSQVRYGVPAASTARADALKAKLTGKAPTQNPAPPRVGRTSARQEEFAKLPNQVQTPRVQTPSPVGNSSARQAPKDLSQVAPPPSGLAPGATAPAPQGAPMSQTNNSVETEGTPTEATSEPLSPQFVALAKQERMIRKARMEQKAREDAWKQDQAKFISKDELLADPLKVLSEAGITYDKLTESQLSQLNPDPNQALLDQIAELKARLEGVDETFKKRDSQAYDAALNQIRSDVGLLVDSDPAFETIKATGQSEDVVDLIKRVFDAEGTVLPVEEACKLVEDKLVDREFERVQKISQLSKIKSRMEPPAEIPEEATLGQQPTIKTQTLTNQGSLQRPLSARERAILAFKKAESGE